MTRLAWMLVFLALSATESVQPAAPAKTLNEALERLFAQLDAESRYRVFGYTF